jgi:hypothetical protein
MFTYRIQLYSLKYYYQLHYEVVQVILIIKVRTTLYKTVVLNSNISILSFPHKHVHKKESDTVFLTMSVLHCVTNCSEQNNGPIPNTFIT